MQLLKPKGSSNLSWYSYLVVVLCLCTHVRAITWPWEDSSSSSSGSSATSSSSDSSSTNGITWPWQDNGDSSSSASSESSSSSASSSSGGSNSSGGSSASSESSTRKDQYAPYETSCPSGDISREAKNISSSERDYMSNRHETTNKNLIDFLSKKANLSDFDAKSFINDYSDEHNISIGLAFSGGGYRAMLNGAGQILGLDDRYDEAKENGLGGLLQSSSYLAGLSGGNWLVGSLVLNNWISVADIIEGDIDIWNLEDSIFNPSGINLVKTVRYYNNIRTSIEAKQDAGFDTSLTDLWGRALSHQFFPDEDGGENVTWSSIRDLSKFSDYEMPFPIVIADGRTPGTFIMDSNSSVFEINPYELGSWDPSVQSFVDVKYVGSSMKSNDPNTSKCVVNFDNGGFIMGTSSTLFNQGLLRISNTGLNKAVKSIVSSILGKLSYAEDDIAAYEPNPFYENDFGTYNSISTNNTLFLVDGGEDQQNIPLYPLIQNARDVDIIFAYDNSADTDSNWPNGTSLVHTYRRQFSKQGKGTPFPYVPSEEIFVKDELNKQPVFFGCDAGNLTSLLDFHKNSDINETDVPLVVYMPNYRTSYNSNTSTYKMSYDEDEKMGIIKNGFEVSTSKNLTDDSDWAKCVGCAIIRRSQERLGQEQSSECKKCFDNYCWSGGEKAAASSSVSGSSSTSESSSTSKSSSSSKTSSTSQSSSSDKPKGSNANALYISLPLAFFTSFIIALSLLV